MQSARLLFCLEDLLIYSQTESREKNPLLYVTGLSIYFMSLKHWNSLHSRNFRRPRNSIFSPYVAFLHLKFYFSWIFLTSTNLFRLFLYIYPLSRKKEAILWIRSHVHNHTTTWTNHIHKKHSVQTLLDRECLALKIMLFGLATLNTSYKQSICTGTFFFFSNLNQGTWATWQCL